jgi:hypothetical protein
MSCRLLAPLAVTALAAAAIGTAWSSASAPTPTTAAPRPAAALLPPQYGPTLPPATTHGLAQRLRQYPAVELATPRQRAAAERLLAQLRVTARRWADPRAARAAGFDVRRPHRRPGETRVMWFHSESHAWHNDDRYLDPRRPDTLIYADVPGRPLSSWA